MSTLATDDFNRANGGLGTNWTTVSGFNALSISSNACIATNDPCGAYYNAVTPPNNQWTQCTAGTLTGSGDLIGPAIRMSTSTDAQYWCGGNTSDTELWLANGAGGYTLLGSSTGISPGNTLYLEAQGTAIVMKVNGVNRISVTNATLTGGRGGLFGSNGATNPTLDDFSVGDFGGGGGGAAPGTLMLMGAGT